MNARLIIAIVLVVLVMVLIFQNTEMMTFRIFFWDPAMSRIIWMLIVLVIGFAAGYLTGRRGRKGPAEPRSRTGTGTSDIR